MATVTTAAPGKTAPWRGLSRLSQEQVVGAVTVFLLIVFALRLPGFATTQNILGLDPQHFDSRHSRPRHGADRHQPRHRFERDRAHGLSLGDRAHRQSARASRRSGPRCWLSSLPSASARQWPDGRLRRGAGLVRHAGDHLRDLRRGLLGRAGLCGLRQSGVAWASVLRARQRLRHTDADLRLRRGGAGDARLPLAHLDRPLHLRARRQSRGGAAVRHRACGR